MTAKGNNDLIKDSSTQEALLPISYSEVSRTNVSPDDKKCTMDIFIQGRKREALFLGIGGLCLLVGLILIVISAANFHASESKCDCNKTLSNDGSLSKHDVDVISHNPVMTRNDFLLGKVTKQSSTILDASLAIDGNKNRNFKMGSCSQTELEANPYWMVDFGFSRSISSVGIVSRTDCCENDLHDVEIRVGNNATFQDNDLCYHSTGNMSAALESVQCGIPLNGRYLSIQIKSKPNATDQLVLCEITL